MILLFEHQYLRNRRILDRLDCSHIGNEKPLKLFFQIAFGKKS